MKVVYNRKKCSFDVDGAQIKEIDFNFISCNLFRVQEEYEYLKLKGVKPIKKELLKDDNGRIYIYAKTNDGHIFIKINEFEKSFSIDELVKLNDLLSKKIDEAYNLKYDIKNFDPIFLSIFLWKRLHKIKDIIVEDEYIDNLCVPKGKNGVQKITDTPYYKTLEVGKEIDIKSVFNSNHVDETHYERIMKIKKSIEDNGYPYKNQYIIVYNNENKIRDGQHRACTLKYLYGNIKVPIMRIILENNS